MSSERIIKAVASVPACLIYICVVFQALGSQELLRYEQVAIAHGESWRLFSGNFVHMNIWHLFLNLVGIVLIASLGMLSNRQLLWGVTLSGLAVGLGLYWFSPHVVWYVGMSGILHGLLVQPCIRFNELQHSHKILFTIVVLKLIYEQLYGPLPGSADIAHGPIITAAHAYGAVGGALAGLLWGLKRWVT